MKPLATTSKKFQSHTHTSTALDKLIAKLRAIEVEKLIDFQMAIRARNARMATQREGEGEKKL